MALFQTSVLKKYLATQNKPTINKAFWLFWEYFADKKIQQNIRDSKEEQFQEGFLRELFVKVLGYTLNPNPNYNLTTEFKNQKGAGKADGAMLQDGKAVGVIELKSTKTKDLEDIRRQAFDYKANQPACQYVVTSNFEKLRFYIQNAVDFEEFDLFNMTPERFEVLWLCLSADSLFKGIPLKAKQDSLLDEENITKKLYKDYTQFKSDLFSDLVTGNLARVMANGHTEKEARLLLFQKSQKLLDRFLFIFFAEDRGLLPPNSINQIVAQWEKLKELDEYRPLYDRYKKYFTYLNEGGKGKNDDIFAYNGGLFRHDEWLDNLIISDDVLRQHTLKLTAYDFETEIDVNILGHIFENSLNETEEVTAQIEGGDFDQKKTKRKKDGVFYTPKYITKYIVDNTLGRLCEEKKTELGIVEEKYFKGKKEGKKGRKKEDLQALQLLLKPLEIYREWLLSLTVCDPACGSGAFLSQALDFLIAEHGYIDELQAKLLGSSIVFPDVENTILERNIYGVDINEEATEIAKLSLWLRTAKKGRKLTKLSSNIKCGNSLIDDPAVAGELAFNWAQEFPEVFANGGFDVIIGNPPYTYRNAINEAEKEYFKEKYLSVEGNYDLYKFFLEKLTFLSKNGGLSSFIVPNTFLTATTYKRLRGILIEHFFIEEIFDLGLDIFENVVVESIIITAKRSEKPQNDNVHIKIQRDRKREFENLQSQHLIDLNKYSGEDLTFNIYISDKYFKLIDKIKADSLPLSEICYCTVGINTGYIKEELTSDRQIGMNYHKMLHGKDIGRYFVKWAGEYIMYDVAFVKLQGERGRSLPPEYIFTSEKILVQRTRRGMKRKLVCFLDKSGKFYNLNRLSNIILTDNTFSLDVIYPILNSKLLDFYFNIYFNEYEVKPLHLGQLPINKNCMVCSALPLKGVEINDTIEIFHKNREGFLSLLKAKLNLSMPSKKLQNWHELEFKDFLDELKKAKVTLKLSAEAEWMDYFKEQKAKAIALQNQITTLDHEIDQLVYQLYGLTEEEIAIVEQGTNLD